MIGGDNLDADRQTLITKGAGRAASAGHPDMVMRTMPFIHS